MSSPTKFEMVFRMTFPWFFGSESEFLTMITSNPEQNFEAQIKTLRDRSLLTMGYEQDSFIVESLQERQFSKAIELISQIPRTSFLDKWQIWRQEVCKEYWGKAHCSKSEVNMDTPIAICACNSSNCLDNYKIYIPEKGFYFRYNDEESIKSRQNTQIRQNAQFRPIVQIKPENTVNRCRKCDILLRCITCKHVEPECPCFQAYIDICTRVS